MSKGVKAGDVIDMDTQGNPADVCSSAKKTVNILGSKYEIAIKKPGEDNRLENCDGYTDWTLNLISILDPKKDNDSVGDMEAYKRKVLRHEITHAFMMESGLMASTNQGECGGAYDEQMVDWFAIQGPKIYEAWKFVGAV